MAKYSETLLHLRNQHKIKAVLFVSVEIIRTLAVRNTN